MERLEFEETNLYEQFQKFRSTNRAAKEDKNFEDESKGEISVGTKRSVPKVTDEQDSLQKNKSKKVTLLNEL